MKRHWNWRNGLGWTAVGVSLLLACFWAFWGSIETFHEGWYLRSAWKNLGLTFVQYLSPMLAFMLAALCSLRWPLPGGLLHVGLGIFAALFFSGFAGRVLIALPIVLLGVSYSLGRPRPLRLAQRLIAILPVLTAVVCGGYAGYRALTGAGDVDPGVRVVEGNGVRLTWAPQGPGWPDTGTDWNEARSRCEHLTADGLALSASRLGVWRLPTADEVVRSLTSRGVNSGGVWNEASREATYRGAPEKEPPLWNPRTQVIYWWTASEVGQDMAIRVVYNGKTVATPKNLAPGYLGHRCVTAPK